MKAAVHTGYGPPDVVRIMDVETPPIRNNELLVQVHATTVNRTDCAFRSARPFVNRFFTGLIRPRATILGTEFAGVVAAVGSAVTAFAVGDRVVGYPARGGSHAQYMSTPADGPVATGGIGSAAVQLVKVLGANVTAVCGTEHVELIRALGADRVIDYMAGDFTTDDQRYDVVLDAVGKSSFGRCRRLLKPGGIYLSSELGPLSQNPLLALVTPVLRGKRVMFPIPKQSPEIVQYLNKLIENKLIESGQFTQVIDRRYPLDEIVEAYRYVETGQKIGNVLIGVA